MGAGAIPCAEFGQRIRNKTEIEETFFAWGQGFMSGMNTMFDFAGADTRDMNAISVTKAEALAQSSELCRHHFNGAFLEILVDRLSMANSRLSQLLTDKNISVF